MLLRNRELTGFVLAYAAIAIAVCALAAGIDGPPAALWAGAAALAVGVLVAAETRARYRAIARMTSELERVLHGGRSLDIDHMSEGELAVLSNELSKMVARLNLTADRLGRERMALADALADISHQLKTPLTSLSITTELVRKRLVQRGGCSQEVERLHVIERLQLHIEQLVSSLLKLARLDAGAVELARQPVDVERLVAIAFEPLAVAYDIADVSFEHDIAAGTTFAGDLSWTAEAVTNILKNCMEHTPPGGRVRIRAWEDTLGCRITIEDNGTGISSGDLPHIFERFYRGSDSVSPGHGEGLSQVNPVGVGIGLSLAKSLITAQDGTIKASNIDESRHEGRGARFEITFFKSVV
ncbi:sensor histidine kinase [Coriobacterium glomerans]|nr:HAMP domain-containing sensor histidine kinase [Coriobacterium glomerans]